MAKSRSRSNANEGRLIEQVAPDRSGISLSLELSAWQRRQLNRFLADLPGSVTSLPEAVDRTLQQVVNTLGWTVAFARWSLGPEAGDAWYTNGGSNPHLDSLRDTLKRGPVVAWNGSGNRSQVRLERLVALPETRGREAARRAGMAGYAVLPVFAEGKPMALLELFATTAPPRSGGIEVQPEVFGALEVLGAQLSLIAARDRLRSAVGRAAAHSRRQTGDLEEARSDLKRARRAAVLYDQRTGLPGPEILSDRIRQAIRRRQRSPKETFAVIAAQVEGLDRVESRNGDSAAADVMVAAARRLSGSTRPADSVALDTEGRFVVVVERLAGPAEALDVADRVQKELRRPFPLTHSDIRLDARIGVVFAGPAYETPEALLSDAAAAAVRAARAENRVQVFDRSVRETDHAHEQMRSELADALGRGEIHLEYQPIVSLQDGRITGLEAFMRWRHPQLGLVPPDRFIPAAESSDLIHELGCWAIEQVCEQIGRWRDHLGSRTPPPVGLNVSGRQLYHEGFLRQVRDTLERLSIKGHQLRFDVSEADLMRDPSAAAAMVARLQGMGIEVVIDDFGTGFSSLSMLHDLPVSALKIDRSFVSHQRERSRKWGVARTIVELARILEVDVIAEGIETREQFLTLKKAGCTQAQGYHFSGPVGADEAESMIRDGYPLDLEAPAR